MILNLKTSTRLSVLLIGKLGMLGSCFLKQLAGVNCEVFAFDRHELDVTDFEALTQVFERIKPDLVINCTGYTAVDDAENNRDLAFLINSEAVKVVADLCGKDGATLIHFSTDYVFDGEKPGGYNENDETGPINVYGESKLAGERAVLESGAGCYIVRTSWLFGPAGKNFVDTMLRLGKEALKDGKELRVVNDQVGSPTFTEDLCGAVVENFVKSLIKKEKTLPFGIYHLTNSGNCSWYDFAKKIFEMKGLAVSVRPVSSAEFPGPAKRPKCSILKNSKIKPLRNWQEAVAAYLKLSR